MKKLFFLFAAAALLASCSSDGLDDVVGGGTDVPSNPATEYVSSSTVEFTNGTSVSVGALDDGTQTRADESSAVKFVIDLNKIDGVEDVLRRFSDYKLKADDFIIRRDGEYVPDIKPTDNKYQYYTIEMVEENLKVAVKNLEKLTFADCNDYTFEFYLWIENKKLKDDGTGAFGELFTYSDKVLWVGTDFFDEKSDGFGEAGEDLSYGIWTANGSNGDNFFENNNGGEQCGLLVRYNVYRGLSGRPVNEDGEYDEENGLGDTPYIKVSVHVEKKPQTTEASKKNECTWVGTKPEA